MKYCKKCNKEKDSSEFYTCNTRKDGLQIYCKECISKNVKLNYQKNKDRLIKKQRGYNIFNKYGITEGEYNKMLSQQNNKCAICGSSEIKRKEAKYFNIDHCHSTGKVRGLLCHDCNIILGKLNDDIEMCKKIITYLSF